jgi:hypothetical protein
VESDGPDLRVGDLEGDVSEPLRLGELTGAMDRGRGHADPQRAALRGDTRRFTGRLPGPTSDIQDAVVAPDTPGPAERFVVQPQLGVKVDRARLVWRPMSRGWAMRRVGMDGVWLAVHHPHTRHLALSARSGQL